MPSFDVVSEVDVQEVRNAIDQAHRELTTRFDFKGTDTTVEFKDSSIELESASEERLKAATQVLEEKLVKRKVSLKALDYGKVEDLINQLEQMPTRLKNLGSVFLLCVCRRRGGRLHELGETKNRVERASKFMAHTGEKVGLCEVRLLRSSYGQQKL